MVVIIITMTVLRQRHDHDHQNHGQDHHHEHYQVSIVHDAVAIGVFFPSHTVFVTWFSFFAAVGNLALRFFSSFILYRWELLQSSIRGSGIYQSYKDYDLGSWYF